MASQECMPCLRHRWACTRAGDLRNPVSGVLAALLVAVSTISRPLRWSQAAAARAGEPRRRRRLRRGAGRRQVRQGGAVPVALRGEPLTVIPDPDPRPDSYTLTPQADFPALVTAVFCSYKWWCLAPGVASSGATAATVMVFG